MEKSRVVFLDWLRVLACFMVMVVHSCELFYFNDNGDFAVDSSSAAFWVSWVDAACRQAVPLFVMASAFLLFPVNRSTGGFFRRRLMRVVVPFVFWACVYTAANGDEWGRLLFNFPDAAGHLWFVPMLLGLYLLMPLLSPWAEKVEKKELRGWLILWFFTTTFPFVRKLWGTLYGDPSFGAVPYLWGECPWNAFGTFHYVSGFVGYLLLGLYFRKFIANLSVKRVLVWAVPVGVIGYAIVGGFFYGRIPDAGGYPVVKPYATAVDLEMSWEFCSLGVALTVLATFAILKAVTREGKFYTRVILPLSQASYGTYLVHMLILTPVGLFYKEIFPVPLTILCTAATTFLCASGTSLIVRSIPVIGKRLA